MKKTPSDRKKGTKGHKMAVDDEIMVDDATLKRTRVHPKIVCPVPNCNRMGVRNEINIHMLNDHCTKTKRCVGCKQKFRLGQLVNHYTTFKYKKYTPKSKQTYANGVPKINRHSPEKINFELLIKHLRKEILHNNEVNFDVILPDQREQLECYLCHSTNIKSKVDLKRHMKQKHPVEKDDDNGEAVVVNETPENEFNSNQEQNESMAQNDDDNSGIVCSFCNKNEPTQIVKLIDGQKKTLMRPAMSRIFTKRNTTQ